MRALGAAALVLVVVSSAAAAPAPRPTTGRCLRAWNATGNAANRNRVAALGAAAAQLGAGVVGIDTWRLGGPARSTQSQACLLAVVRGRRVSQIVGVWSHGHVTRWRFFPAHPASAPPENVRVRADGRLSLG